AWLANYVIWNWIPADPLPLHFGYGDTPHVTNRLPADHLYTHMANVRHLYGRSVPEAAALARHLQEKLPRGSYSSSWFVYPFLLSRLDESPGPLAPANLPRGGGRVSHPRIPPTARHFENMGQIFMRSGTGPGDTYCLFTCGGILAQHRHFDALNFVIYHRGFLALDSGTRYKEFDNGQHLANYFAQTVAHNCVVIHQPGEPPAKYWGGTVVGNHGGQHRQLGSVVKAFETNRDFVYVAGDATACYRHGTVRREGQGDLPEKCSLVTRQFVFLIPNHFVIFDRVTTTDRRYRKDWLIHTAHRPRIADRTIRADHGDGRMFCRTLMPTDARLTAVGGPGNQFRAAGRNWDIDTGNLKPENLAMMGQWRVEVTPGTLQKKDLFLHVIQVGDRDLQSMDQTERIEADGLCGVRLTTGGQKWEVTFSTTGDPAGHIKRSGDKPAIHADLATSVQPQRGIIADGG
ncbi:MAG: heparinase II/III domain-containing protein, partial [Planctomycetota bacterium]